MARTTTPVDLSNVQAAVCSVPASRHGQASSHDLGFVSCMPAFTCTALEHSFVCAVTFRYHLQGAPNRVCLLSKFGLGLSVCLSVCTPTSLLCVVHPLVLHFCSMCRGFKHFLCCIKFEIFTCVLLQVYLRSLNLFCFSFLLHRALCEITSLATELSKLFLSPDQHSPHNVPALPDTRMSDTSPAKAGAPFHFDLHRNIALTTCLCALFHQKYSTPSPPLLAAHYCHDT